MDEFDCPVCGYLMQPENAHEKCTRCGYRTSCCEGAPL